MIDKLGINIVGAVDHSTRLYNRGEGFRAMTGTIGFGSGDGIYLGFTAERAYAVAVEGDLTLSTETSDSRPDQIAGVYGFDIDWNEAAKTRGSGAGKIAISNPNAPGQVSVFEVRMTAAQSVTVKFGKETGTNVRVVLGADSDLSKLDREVGQVLGASDVPQGELRVNATAEPMDTVAARRALQRGSARPSGFIPQDVSDHWAGSDVSHLRRNILT